MKTNKALLSIITAAIVLLPMLGMTAEEKKPQRAKAKAVARKTTRLPDHMLRDPFWPIGEQPAGWGQEEDEKNEIDGIKEWDVALKKIKLSGISKDSNGNYFAGIRGHGVVEKGDVISVDYGGLTYSWRIKDVTKRGIVPVKLNVAPTK